MIICYTICSVRGGCMNKFMKVKNYLLAFFLPLLLCLLIFYLKGILQSVEDIYVSDLRLQHISFLNYLKNVLVGKTSIYYSFYAGMGNPMLANMIFYALSPINMITFIIKDIRYAIIFVYMIKLSLSGLTMYMLLKSKTERDDLTTVLFSTCFALSSFAINYFFCIFWFDCLYLAPLVVMGIDKMYKTEKINLLYIFSLALAIICNIQMGFGLCVFSVLYYLYCFFVNYNLKDDKKKFIQLGIVFAISSLCAGAVSSGVLLGFVTEYRNISLARELKVSTVAGTSNITYIIKGLFSVGNLKTDYYNNYEPFTYCGLIISYFSVLYFFNKNIDKRKRVAALGVILVFVISFCINSLNLFWHLSSPVLLNYRYSIYLALFLTVLAYECYANQDKLVKRDIVVLSIALLFGLSCIVMYANEIYILYTFIFLLLIFTFIIFAKNRGKVFEYMLIIAVLVEIVVNGYTSLYTARQLPFGKISSYDNLIKESNFNNFDDNYRLMYDHSYTDFTNDTLLLNKNSSLRYFSSVINGYVTNFFDWNFSTVGNNNYRLSAYDNPLLLSLLGNKYFYLLDEIKNNLYNKVDSYKITSYDYVQGKNDTKNVYLYENPYALSLGYVIDGDVKHNKKMEITEYQNAIIKAFTGTSEDVVYSLDVSANNDNAICSKVVNASCMTFSITNDTDNSMVYAYSNFSTYNVSSPNAKVYIDTGRPIIISTLDKNFDLTLTSDSVNLELERFVASTYNRELLIRDLEILRKNMLKDIKINKNVMTGKISSSKDGILFLSIPYDNKFQIFVDNKRVKYYSLLDNSFIGLDLKKGEHNIKLKYVDDNLRLYVISSAVSIIVTFIIYYFVNKKINVRLEKERKELEERLQKRVNRKQKKKNRK